MEYPYLSPGATIGMTAPSSGVPTELHHLIEIAAKRMEERGYKIIIGDTVWKQYKAKSSSARKRADEFNEMAISEEVDCIIPPWGGELLIEMLPYVDFDRMKPKWILGYSDTSVLLLAITLKTGIATAHGTNIIDLRGEYEDETTAMWQTVLQTKAGDSVLQHSSLKFQKEWQHDNPSPCVFHLTEMTNWQVINEQKAHVSGRLLGGCIDVIRHLIGTPFGNIQEFHKRYINEEPIIWYFENCELTTTDVRRTLMQMRLAGWFDHCAGILFGRSAADTPVDNYQIEDVYLDLHKELKIPIIYDADFGHVPPQMTFINGAIAEVEVVNGKGTVLQAFK